DRHAQILREVESVLHEQPRDAAERLVERQLLLRELDVVLADDADRRRHARERALDARRGDDDLFERALRGRGGIRCTGGTGGAERSERKRREGRRRAGGGSAHESSRRAKAQPRMMTDRRQPGQTVGPRSGASAREIRPGFRANYAAHATAATGPARQCCSSLGQSWSLWLRSSWSTSCSQGTTRS